MKRTIIATDLIRKNFNNTKMTFSVEHIKADDFLMVKPTILLYTSGKQYLANYSTTWWVVCNEYQKRYFTFNIPRNTLNQAAYYRVRLWVDNLSLHNNLYFNHLQLAEGSVTDYHEPESTLPKTDIKFSNSFYANLYTSEDNYLQVIRPYYNNIDTETIKKSKTTVLAPHLANEDEVDNPASIGLEYMGATDQVIEILR